MSKEEKGKNNEKAAPVEASRGVVSRDIVPEMKESYLDYAMSVITQRALPDVRDGLKPVHRRILFSMHEMGLTASARFRKSAAIVGECFVKGTLVSTPKGLTPIEKLGVGDLVYTQNGAKKITERYIMPERPLIKVTLQNGLANTVTPSQKFKVLTKERQYIWKEAKDLASEDYVVMRGVYPEISDLAKLPGFRGKNMTVNSSLAYMLGQLISDGWVSYDYGLKKMPRLGFCSSDRVVMEKIRSVLSHEFGYEAKIEVKRKKLFKPLYYVRVSSSVVTKYVLGTFFGENIKLTAHTKYIPEQIFKSPRSVISAFFAGLYDGDGSFNSAKRSINYTTVSPRLAAELQSLFISLAINARCYTFGSENKPSRMIAGHASKSNYPAFAVEIAGSHATVFSALVKDFLETPRKKIRAESIANTEKKSREWSDFDVIPYASGWAFGELSFYHIGSGWYRNDDTGEKFRDGITYQGGGKMRYASAIAERPLRGTQIIEWGIAAKLRRVGSPLAEFFEDIIKNGIFFTKISSVESAPAEITYDIQVADDHEFVANGQLVHNCLGKYHPHGDVAVYDSMVKMAQIFSLRYPLVMGQGNFGSIDGDSQAAMRYTEAKMSRVAGEMIRDLDKETVEWRPNYDGTRKEPIVMPSLAPNLLLNGTLGIAVGMASNIPPHNLREVADAIIYLIDDKNATTEDLLKFIKGPDFPTGGVIYGDKDIAHAYGNGKGGVVARGEAEIVETKSGMFQIIITSIPYRVNKSVLIESIANLVREKKLEGIKGLRDESAKDIRIAIDLKNGSHPQAILNYLYKHTQLEETFHFNMVALVDGVPKTLSLKTILEEFIKHRQVVVRRRTEFDLRKAEAREHILLGLSKALDHIDEIIKLIKKAKDVDEARANLMKQFKFSELQANAILDMKLQRLAGLERKKIEDELKAVQELIKSLKEILSSVKRMLTIVKDELREAAAKYGDDRRTKVVKHAAKEFSLEDTIPDSESILVLTTGGYIKRTDPDEYRKQRRGGVGVVDLDTKEEDFVSIFLTATTHNDLLFFTDKGKAYQIKMYDIPEGRRATKGKSVMNFISLGSDEKVTSVLAMPKEIKKSALGMMLVTKQGTAKKVDAASFHDVRRSGIIAIRLDAGDALESASFVDKGDQIIIATAKGQSLRFKESDVRLMGRAAGGVRAIRLGKGDAVVGADVVKKDAKEPRLLVVMENGYGKTTPLKEYKIQHRGGSGIKTAKITPKTGNLMTSRVVVDEEAEVAAISKKSQVIRVDIKEIPSLGRQTQGVRIMKLREGDSIASIVCL